MIPLGRIKVLSEKEIQDRPYIVYWMQASQRTYMNHALEYAIGAANELGKKLLVYFGLTDGYPEADRRHYSFMLQGLADVRRSLMKRGIRMVVLKVRPDEGLDKLRYLTSMIVTDRGYLRIQREWRLNAAERADCRLVEIESDVMVPVEIASSKEEFSAATIRRKLEREMSEYSVPLYEGECNLKSLDDKLDLDELDITDESILDSLNLPGIAREVQGVTGGQERALELLEEFVEGKLDTYGEGRNEPGSGNTSGLSPYLHFGQISPLQIYMRIYDIKSPGKAKFLDELVVRRELAINYLYYNTDYDSFSSLPKWASETLERHLQDEREYIYGMKELEAGLTHDTYWNAAQTEMVLTGKMDGYMRMYWGKKILEWSRTPEEAFRIALELNNRYSLDGRDPSSFAGVAWCFGKHDRPWGERSIFGNVRYMNDKGLKRKFDMERYLEKVENDKRVHGIGKEEHTS
ncbi:deoxyribodipyrimidine photo-lyase [Youngiibacter fragilis]|uniref:Deoxyribodipyrimidine photo-lyase n=1 Tax=Youngiibacter fragilis 232.1 TaxID=994573 RepID=V7I7W8_9CLOT|nr:deoxyribodipyrimidine photo-lyase [Youngiibacter fragilis]ETA82280.1 DNA photolyase [Youngiibacter fragilis 232.1]